MKSMLLDSRSLLHVVFFLATALRISALEVSPPLITPGVSPKEFELKERVATTCNDEICTSGYTCTGPINGLAKCCSSGSSCAIRTTCTPSSVVASLNAGTNTVSSNSNAIYCTYADTPYCNTYIYLQYNSVSLIGCDSQIALGSKSTITGTFGTTSTTSSTRSTTSTTSSSSTSSSTTSSPTPTSSSSTATSTSTSTSTTSSASPTSTGSSGGLATGAIAGIGVGAGLVAIAIIGAIVFLLLKSKKNTSPKPVPAPVPDNSQYPPYQNQQPPMAQQNPVYNPYNGPVSPVAPGSPPPQWSPQHQSWAPPAVNEIGPGKD